jgi:hypothetical protein
MNRIFKRWQASITIKHGIIRLFTFAILVSIVSHWYACFFYLAATLSDPSETTWVKEAGLEQADKSEIYLAGLYWAVMTLTTIGYGDISAYSTVERAFSVVGMLFGVLLFAYVIGTITGLIEELDPALLEFQSNMDLLNTYLRNCRVPQQIQKRVRRYCYYKKDVDKEGREQELLALTSPALREEILLYRYYDILCHIPQFKAAQETCPSFLGRVVCALRATLFGPDELIIKQGFVTDDAPMYIIRRGSVVIEKVISNGDVRPVRDLGAGSFFGERSLLFNTLRTMTVRSTSFVDCVCLSKTFFNPILDSYPEVKRQIHSAFVKHMFQQYCVESGSLAKALRKGRNHWTVHQLNTTSAPSPRPSLRPEY